MSAQPKAGSLKHTQEILRETTVQLDETRKHAERLAEAVTDLLADSRSLEARHYATTQLEAWKGAGTK